MILSALIPAAGLSSRMHEFKPLLKLGKLTMIETVIGLFRNCGITDIIVVTGHHAKLLTPVIQKAGAKPILNPDFNSGMFGSIRAGIRHLSPESAGFFLLPSDIPAIRPATIKVLTGVFNKNPGKIIIPRFNGRSGHPPLIPAGLIPDILAADPCSNLREFINSRKEQRVWQTVQDQGILMDADTPEDYLLLAKASRKFP